jgi:hypothetical protein
MPNTIAQKAFSLSGCVSKKNFCLPPGLEEEAGAHVRRLPISLRSRLAFVRKLK